MHSKILSFILNVFGWIFGMLLSLSFFVFFSKGLTGFTAAIILLVAGLIIIPPIYHNLIKAHIKKLPKFSAAIVSFVLFILGVVIAPNTPKNNTEVAGVLETNSSVSASLINKMETELISQKLQEEKKIFEEEQRKKEEKDKKAAELAAKEAEKNKTPEQKINDFDQKQAKGTKVSLKEDMAVMNYDVSEGAFWDDKHVLETMLEKFIIFGKEVFTIEGVNSAKVQFNTKLVDNFGNESDGILMAVSMDKETFLKFKWKNLNSGSIYSRIQEAGDIYVLPSTMQKIDKSKIKVIL